jgi:aspartyl aminopeptidase
MVEIGVGIPVMGLPPIREVVSRDDVKKLEGAIRAFFALNQ